jgi:SAM-dependent MidA family methyltransferase
LKEKQITKKKIQKNPIIKKQNKENKINYFENLFPTTVENLLEESNYGPIGYYRHRSPIGTDFITATEISDDIAIAICNRIANIKVKFNIVEFGIGNGSLMRSIRKLNTNNNFCEYIGLEISEQVNGFDRIYKDIGALLSEVCGTFCVFIGNEFLDTFSVQHYIGGRIIIFDSLHNMRNFYISDKSKSVLEFSPKCMNFLCKLWSFMQQNASYCILIDYAKDYLENSIVSYYRHNSVFWLDYLGIADISSHVPFKFISSHCPLKNRITLQRDFIDIKNIKNTFSLESKKSGSFLVLEVFS